MTLDEAIRNEREAMNENAGNRLCAEYHWQIAEWLLELKVRRSKNSETAVHCRDCRYYDSVSGDYPDYMLCYRTLTPVSDPDGSCRYGERKRQ